MPGLAGGAMTTGETPGPRVGLAIEAATERVEVLVAGGDLGDDHLALEVESVGHGHTRRLAPLVARALERARVCATDLRWVAADLGPGSFTGVRVGLATAEALALAAGARLVGASSLASLAGMHGRIGSLIVPLVPAGRRDLYAGFYRRDRRNGLSLLAAPRVGPPDEICTAVGELLAVAGVASIHFIGPGAGRVRDVLERAYPGSATPPVRFEGLSAADLVMAALSTAGPRAGLPAPGEAPDPLYVRPAQAEERVRRAATAGDPATLRPMEERDLVRIAAVEREVFSDPWPESFFRGELTHEGVHAVVAEFGGELAGYCVAWLGGGTGHLGNLAVVPGRRRRGIARRLVEDLQEHARAVGAAAVTLEVRVSNFAAQGLYRAHGFRMAGLRRRYYRDTGEDALVMQWHAPAAGGDRGAHPDAPEAHSTLP